MKHTAADHQYTLETLLLRAVQPRNDLVSVQHLSTKFGEHAFSFAGPHAWNNLPDELRRIINATTFKKHLKTHFLIMLLTSFAFS